MRPGCTIGLVFFFSFSVFFQDVDLIATSLRAGFQVYLSRSWVLCLQTKVVRYLFLRVDSDFWILCSFLVNCFGGWDQQMWLVSCRRQGMMTQGPAPDLTCKLNISSLLALPNLLDCLICTSNSVSIVLGL